MSEVLKNRSWKIDTKGLDWFERVMQHFFFGGGGDEVIEQLAGKFMRGRIRGGFSDAST